MKKLLLPLLLIICLGDAFGQADNYRFIRVDFGFSYINPTSNRFANGFGFSPELKFQITDNHTIGGRMDVFVMVGDNAYVLQGTQLSSQAELKTGAIVGFSLLNEYFLTDTKLRPFVGAGFGFYAGGSASESVNVNVNGGSLSADASAFAGMGFSPTAGFHIGTLKLSVGYYLILSQTDVNVNERIVNGNLVEDISLVQEESNNFLVFKLSLGIGGGRK